MPKYVSPTALKLLEQKTGTEPFIVVVINWGAGRSYYSTRIIDSPHASVAMNANIMEMGTIKNEKRGDSMCNVGSCHLKFSDADGQMKFVIDNILAENVPAAIYLAFNGTSESDWIELLLGRTVGPIIWDETERTFEFSIETYVHSFEIGYAATYQDFSDLNHNAAGVPWPLIFGKCSHVPALLVRVHSTTHLQCQLRLFLDPVFQAINNGDDIIMLGNPDTLCLLGDDIEKNVLYVDDASQFPLNKTISITIEDVVFVGKFTDNTKFVIQESNAPRYVKIPVIAGPVGDPDLKNNQVIWIDDIKDPGDLDSWTPTLANQHCYFNAPPGPNPLGGAFPLVGREWYNFCVKQEGNKCWFRFPFKDPNPAFTEVKPKIISQVFATTKCGLADDVASDHNFMKDAFPFRKKNAGADNFGALKARFNKLKTDGASWWSVPMDTEVKSWQVPNPDIYIASLTPLSEVKAVWGKRKIVLRGKTSVIFDQIPQSYYTISTATYKINGLLATGLIFNTPLKDYAGQDWEDDVFVTATGSIGPGPSDIIKWMLGNYTDLTCDASLFAIAKTKLAGVAANFALFDKRDALKLAQEIAFQARCGLLLDNGGVGMIYLPAQPSQQWNFDESSCKDIQLHFTERKEIVTKFIGTYSTTYKDKHHLAFSHQMNIRQFERVLRSLTRTETRTRSEVQMYIYTNNINVFGLHTKEEAAYIFNDYAPVRQMCNFWGYRFSNCWRMVQIKTWLQGTRLQVWDGVVLAFNDSTILNTSLVPGIIESVDFDPHSFVTTLLVLLPIEGGKFTIDPNFWPG